MLEFYKTLDNETKRIAQPEPGCWINAVSPSDEEVDFLVHKVGVLPEFVKSSLDEEESSHIDYDDDENQTLIIVDYPSAEEREDKYDENTLQYTTLPLGVVIMKGYVITISLHENLNIEDMAKRGCARCTHGYENKVFIAVVFAHLTTLFDLSAPDRPPVISYGTEIASVDEE